MATETVETTTLIGSLCTCASLRVWESVCCFFKVYSDTRSVQHQERKTSPGHTIDPRTRPDAKAGNKLVGRMINWTH